MSNLIIAQKTDETYGLIVSSQIQAFLDRAYELAAPYSMPPIMTVSLIEIRRIDYQMLVGVELPQNGILLSATSGQLIFPVVNSFLSERLISQRDKMSITHLLL
jgi:hypothetical protein